MSLESWKFISKEEKLRKFSWHTGKISFESHFRKRLSKENFLVCHYLAWLRVRVLVDDDRCSFTIHGSKTTGRVKRPVHTRRHTTERQWTGNRQRGAEQLLLKTDGPLTQTACRPTYNTAHSTTVSHLLASTATLYPSETVLPSCSLTNPSHHRRLVHDFHRIFCIDRFLHSVFCSLSFSHGFLRLWYSRICAEKGR